MSARIEKGPWVEGPYKIERYEGSDQHKGQLSYLNAPKVNHYQFATIVQRMDDAADGDRKSAELRATARLFINSPDMADMLRRIVIEHGSRGGPFDELLPMSQQSGLAFEAMQILERIYDDGN